MAGCIRSVQTYEGAVAGWTEQGSAVFLQERPSFRGGGHSVGGLVLVGEGDVVRDAIAFFVLFLYLGHRSLEQFAVLRGNGHNQFDGSVCVAHIGLSFHEMLGNCGADFIRVAMEFQHALRLLAVAQALVEKKLAGSILWGERGLPEDRGVVEGEILELGGKFAYGVVFGFRACKNILEHAGGGTGGGHELAAPCHFGVFGVGFRTCGLFLG